MMREAEARWGAIMIEAAKERRPFGKKEAKRLGSGEIGM